MDSTIQPHTLGAFKVIDLQTGQEANTSDIALREEWAQGLIYCDMEGFAITECGDLVLLDECGNVAFCPQGRFRVEFVTSSVSERGNAG